MIDRGRQRGPDISWRPVGLISSGTTLAGIHHASRMLPSFAPAFIAILSASPVLVGIEPGWVIGTRRKARTYSGSHSKPPLARTTPEPARTSDSPSSDAT